jgi:hypothetical protein
MVFILTLLLSIKCLRSSLVVKIATNLILLEFSIFFVIFNDLSFFISVIVDSSSRNTKKHDRVSFFDFDID